MVSWFINVTYVGNAFIENLFDNTIKCLDDYNFRSSACCFNNCYLDRKEKRKIRSSMRLYKSKYPIKKYFISGDFFQFTDLCQHVTDLCVSNNINVMRKHNIHHGANALYTCSIRKMRV